MCITIYDPVCGSDMNTYPSKCKLSVAQCRNKDITLKYHGKCMPGCEQNPCQYGGRCNDRSDNKGYECECKEHYYGKNCELDIGN